MHKLIYLHSVQVQEHTAPLPYRLPTGTQNAERVGVLCLIPLKKSANILKIKSLDTEIAEITFIKYKSLH